MKRKILLLALLVSTSAAAAPARRGWTKLELTPMDGKGPAVAADVVKASGAEIVSDYGSFAIVAAPAAAVEGLTTAARKRGFAVRRRDELDVIELPAAKVDVRAGIDGVPQSGLVRAYTARKPGLFIIQLAAPPRPEWLAELTGMGWTLARYVQHNAYIAVGVPELGQPTRALSYVQWTEFFHPYQKLAQVASGQEAHDLLFDFPGGFDLTEAIADIEARAIGPVKVDRGRADTHVYAKMTGKDALHVVRHQLVIGVSPRPQLGLSDERQAMAFTSNLDAAQSQPLRPHGYWDWVTSRCTDCATMAPETWRVGVADYGLDRGPDASAAGHPDLENRKEWGMVLPADENQCSTPNTNGCDFAPHGTAVAGVIAGIASGTRPADSGGFFYGAGMAQRSRVFMTSFRWLKEPFDLDALKSWMADAASRGITIQNHSFNEYTQNNYPTDTSGTYTAMARAYDLAVRDASTVTGRQPLLVTISAGNSDQGAQWSSARKYVSAGGTAKNVIAVSGLENARGVVCDAVSSSFKDVMSKSRLGTLMNSAYVKPDLMAPASVITTTRSYAKTAAANCLGISTDYTVNSGTSFAAPAVAGAAILLKRHLGMTPQETSPSLIKAVLIAGARSVRGGNDNTASPPGTIGPVPGSQQGFGRASLDDVLNTPKPVIWDESSSRTFTQTGQRFVGRIKVRANPVKIALVWSDAAATPAGNDQNPRVNDLDLEVSAAGSTTHVFLGNKLEVDPANGEVSKLLDRSTAPEPDYVNNVEYVRFFGTVNQEYEIVIKGANLTCDADADVCPSTPKQDFSVAVVNADKVTDLQAVTLTAPQNVVAAANGPVTITWSAVPGAANYTVERRISNSGWESIRTQPWTQSPATDTPSSSSGVVVYRVIANAAGTSGPASASDVAFVGAFTDSTLPAAPIRAVHVTELRSRINALRTMFDEPVLFQPAEVDAAQVLDDPIDENDFETMRVKLNTALASALVPKTVSFTTAPQQDQAIVSTQLANLRDGFQ